MTAPHSTTTIAPVRTWEQVRSAYNAAFGTNVNRSAVVMNGDRAMRKLVVGLRSDLMLRRLILDSH